MIDMALNFIAWSPVVFVGGLLLVALFQAVFREPKPHRPSSHDRDWMQDFSAWLISGKKTHR